VNFENIDNLIRLLQIFVSGLCEWSKRCVKNAYWRMAVLNDNGV